MTPAVLAAAAFTALAALASVAFVTARGGLELPVAATIAPPVAVASPAATAAASPGSPVPSASVMPPQSAAPSTTAVPTPVPVPTPGPSGPPDPLAALPACPGHPGCYLYTVVRGDSYTVVSDRFGIGLWIMNALNPEVANKGIIVVGQTLYLGHDPMARLDPCPDASCHLYVVRAGDTLSTIAGRYGLGVAGIEALNPALDPTRLVAGQVIRLPLYSGS
ncbi:MAG TPA: LysM peptidoglycan-binding domain-containing protein [Candidatus Limnocylindrales bacterium]|nr:LysM peptidoglycan-binding domain-containing protein [Candidatus Limnocylindrales bacterium]